MSRKHTKRYVEHRFAEYLRNNVSGIQILEGLASEIREPELVEVKTVTCKYADGFPAECGEYEIELSVIVTHAVDDEENSDAHDELCEKIENLLDANPVDDIGDDRLTVHTVIPLTQEDESEDRSWVTSLSYKVICFCGVIID